MSTVEPESTLRHSDARAGCRAAGVWPRTPGPEPPESLPRPALGILGWWWLPESGQQEPEPVEIGTGHARGVNRAGRALQPAPQPALPFGKIASFIRATTPAVWASVRWAYRLTMARVLWPRTSAISASVAPLMAR